MITDQIFDRKTIKSRLQNLIVQRWGYEKYEQNAFDPLVDLLISALAKELEKGHLSFERAFGRIVDFITDRLVPERLDEFEPAFGVLMCHPLDEICEINESNFKASHTNNDDKEIEFVPLGSTVCVPAHVAAIANFNSLIELDGLEQKVLTTFEYKSNNIWIGLELKDCKSHDSIRLFFNWIKDPLVDQYISLLKISNWLIKDELIEVSFDNYLIEHLNENFYWQDILSKEKISLIHNKLCRHFVDVEVSSKQYKNRVTPNFLKLLIKEDPQLAPMNDLLWLRINIPPHDLSKGLSQNIFCQTNCVPIINLNKRMFSKKIRAPFKVVKIDDEDFFLEVIDIENSDGKKYVKIEQEINFKKEELEGIYSVFSKGIIRVDKKMAYESIVNMIDLIIEEKNAYSAINPDWIVDELKSLDLILNKIKSKSNLDKSLINNTTFLQFESELNEDFIKIEYISINGKEANGIKVGESLNVQCHFAFKSGEGLVVEETREGSSFMSKKERRSELVSRIQSRGSVVTRKDIQVHLRKELEPLKIHDIKMENSVVPSYLPNEGYQKVLDVTVDLGKHGLSDWDSSLLQRRLQAYFNSKAMVGLPIRINLN